MRCEPINRFFNGLPFTAILVVALVISAEVFFAGTSGNVQFLHYGGLCFSPDDLAFASPHTSMLLNIAGILAIGTLLHLLNKTFSFIRSVTALNVSAFLMLEAGNPYLSICSLNGSIICIVVLAAAFIMFNAYNKRNAQRSIFSTFALLMLGTTAHYSCLYLIPVFILGFIQMRAMTLKGFLAMGVGLITPLWILLGFGIVTPDDLELPSMHNVWGSLSSLQSWTLLSSAIASAVIMVSLMALNLMHIYSYKTQIRAYNGFFSILSVATIIMMAADYGNIISYMPILNCCLAIQIAHTYTISIHPKRFIAIFVLLAACVASYFLFLLNYL